ncbi:MAG TPA: aromatic ring-hydroxylating dioxygenase subunit alpha [Rubrobacteraceae bacterium]|nr:aromatic ring-hydroxylating dioxygenase subunit alpha [Rubrobacteraceae bacterium]
MQQLRGANEAIEAYHASLEPFWHPVVPSAELGDGPVAIELLGRGLVLARLEGEAAAFDDVCRHLGAALSGGQVVEGGSHLRCPYHGWSYDRSGRCVDIPARRGAAIPREARVRSYATREQYGLIWVCLDEEPEHEIPALPEFDDPEVHKGPLRTYGPWRASAPRIVMAALDDTHFPWVHPGILGDPAHPEPPDHRVYREGEYLVSTYDMMQPANDTISSNGGAGALEKVTYTNYVTATSIRLVKESAAGVYVIWQVASPIAHDRSLIFSRQARSFDRDPARDPEYESLQDTILEQDRPIVESQRPWLLPPLSSRMMLYVRPADLPIVAFQKWLEELDVPQEV